MPAVPRNALYVGLTWGCDRAAINASVEERGRAGVSADDRNTAFAVGYWGTDWRAGFTQRTSRWQLSEYLRLDNLTNRSYVGSVIVNASGGQYFEPKPRHTALLIFTAKWRVDCVG